MSLNTEPKWYIDLINGATNKPKVVMHMEPTSNTIVLNAGDEPMLKVAKDGFYVRGVKVAQDDKEAEVVYNTFKQWLEWTVLNDK
jgi:hypothetical protein